MKTKHLLLSMSASLALMACGETKTVTNTAQISEPCDEINQCQKGLTCENGVCHMPCLTEKDCPDSSYQCENSHCVKITGSLCGNGIEETGEQCDDHNFDDGDGCSSKCNIEANYQCSGWPSVCSCKDGYEDKDGSGICTQIVVVTCGNGEEDPGEMCDDGNSENGDGCSSKCNIEANYQCAGWPSVCSCKDGFEDTDDSGNCTPIVVVTCGNGAEDPGEICDDGNNENGDGCSSKCNIEANYECTGWPSVCSCKDGFQDSNKDGICQPDCNSCEENAECSYTADGKADGCICSDGYQDSNNDGHCLPDCNSCDESQICLYNEDGSVKGCGCPEGTQDNDENGTCEPTCETANLTCEGYQGCFDKSGTAKCECVVYAYGYSKGSGVSWDDLSSFKDSILKAETLAKQSGNDNHCSIWMLAGSVNPLETYTINGNISIYGGFQGTEKSLNTREKGHETIFNGHEKTEIGKFLTINGNVELDNLTFTYFTLSTDDNRNYGAVIYLKENGSLTINESKFLNNTAYVGGAIYSKGQNLIINNSTFTENVSISYGGALGIESDATVKNSLFSKNQSALGGAIRAQCLDSDIKTINIDNVRFINNIARGTGSYTNGGAVSLRNHITNISNSYFGSNNAVTGSTQGGAIYSEGYTNLNLTKNYFVKNMAISGSSAQGGAIWTSNASKLKIVENTFIANVVVGQDSGDTLGGAIYNNAPESTIDRSFFLATKVKGTAPRGSCKLALGAAIFNYNTNLTITNSVFDHLSITSDYSGCAGTSKTSGAAIYNNGVNNRVSVAYSYFGNLDSMTINATIFSEDSTDGIHITNSVGDIGPLGTFTSNVARDQYKFNKNILEQIWINTEYDVTTDLTTITANKFGLWTTNELVGQFIPVNDDFIVPIIENGPNYVVIPGNVANFALSSTYDLDDIFNYKNITLIDLYTLNSSYSTQADIIDKADTSDGPQVTVDIFGKPRSNNPDIGPFEIK